MIESIFDFYNKSGPEWEEKHNAILYWLLNPEETHGLGYYFIKRYLKKAGVFEGIENGYSVAAEVTFHDDDLCQANRTRRLDHLIITDDYYIILENKVKVNSILNDELLDQHILGKKNCGNKKFIHILNVPNRVLSRDTMVLIRDKNIILTTWTDIAGILSGIPDEKNTGQYAEDISKYKNYINRTFVLQYPGLDSNLVKTINCKDDPENTGIPDDSKMELYNALWDFWMCVIDTVRTYTDVPELGMDVDRKYFYLKMSNRSREQQGYFEIYAGFYGGRCLTGLVAYDNASRENIKRCIDKNYDVIAAALPNSIYLEKCDKEESINLAAAFNLKDFDILFEELPISLNDSCNWKNAGVEFAAVLIRHISVYYPLIKDC